MKKISVRIENSTISSIYSGYKLKDIGKKLDTARFGNKVIILSDQRVYPLYGNIVKSSLTKTGKEVAMILLPQGEKTKNITQVIEILKFFAEKKISRDDTLIALGGGVISDIGGFSASIYMRGINFAAVPTTLLAQVDASIGGKTAVNMEYGKNLAGSFYQPSFIYIDISTLKSLPTSEIKQGIAEIIKYGIIKSKDIFELLERTGKDSLYKHYNYLIEESVTIKKSIVEKDERETMGLRDILNFGHTIGHAIEFSSNGQYSHGEAVALGMVCESFISYKMGLSSRDTCVAVKDVVKKFDLPYLLSSVNIDKIFDFIMYDKKIRKGHLMFVLPQMIGKMKCRVTIEKDDIKKIIKEMAEHEDT